MTGRVIEGASAAALTAALETHPALRAAVARISEESGLHPGRVRQLMGAGLIEMLERLGERYVRQTGERLARLDQLRTEVHEFYERVLNGQDQHPDVSSLEQRYAEMRRVLGELTDPQKWSKNAPAEEPAPAPAEYAPAVREAVKGLDPAVRLEIENSPELQALARQSPEQFAEYVADWQRPDADGNRISDRRSLGDYVRSRMRTHVKGLLGEFTAAFNLPEGFGLLKQPDTNVTARGTDFVAFNPHTGEFLFGDNKAYARESISSVSSLERNFLVNLEKDLAFFDEQLAKPENAADPARPALSAAVERARDALARIKEIPEVAEVLQEPGLTEAERAARVRDVLGREAVQQRVTDICDSHRIRRVVTNAAGRLERIGPGLQRRGVDLVDVNAPQQAAPAPPQGGKQP